MQQHTHYRTRSVSFPSEPSKGYADVLKHRQILQCQRFAPEKYPERKQYLNQQQQHSCNIA